MGGISQRAPIMYAPNLFTDAKRNMRNLEVVPAADFEPATLLDPNLLSEVCDAGH